MQKDLEKKKTIAPSCSQQGAREIRKDYAVSKDEAKY